MPRALAVSTYSGIELTPEELAELIDSLREDELLSPAANSDDFDPTYND